MADAFTTRAIDVTTGSRESVHDLTAACVEFLRDAARGRDGVIRAAYPCPTRAERGARGRGEAKTFC
ncbi:hypothetical protein ACIQWR_38425 [Streptomyces sp. NPDC098789]|uniref:hypothetical protein n=1 Tax=Streptomyces sp. NPDC098789 TaxID=3366098 RepID=UPI00381B1243